MLISELAKQAGVSKATIRFYEEIGLIASQERQAGTRLYKEFSQETVEHLRLIGMGKKLGFTLNEMKQLATLWNGNDIPQPEKIRAIEDKLAEIAQKMQSLGEIKAELNAALNQLK